MAVIREALQAHTLFRFITLLLAVGFQIIVVKVLTPESYAAYAILLATLLVGERLLSFGIGRTVLRFVPALVLKQDRSGIKVLALRLGFLRVAGLILFLLALTSSRLLIKITPSALTTRTLVAFGVWFVAYTLLTDANSVAQSLIAHRAAALAAAADALFRTASLAVIYLLSRSIDVETVVIISAVTTSAAFGGLLYSIVLSVSRQQHAGWSALVADKKVMDAAQSQMLLFTAAAYASTLTYLISSPGVIRLVATKGLDIIGLAAYSFAQSLAMALQRGLPGMLIMPSLEPVAAQMVESGRGDNLFPALSLLFKFELTCVLAVIIAMQSAGADIFRILSRPAYAPFYYVLPFLMAGVILTTVYRVLEILGSMNLTFKIFLTMWPLSAIAVAALYLTVGRWGLISVLAVPIVEMVARVAILLFAFRHQGVRNALDPGRSARLVLSAGIVLLCSSYVIARYGASFANATLLVAIVAVGVFLSALFVIRPLSARECETLSRSVPESWRFPRYIARALSSS